MKDQRADTSSKKGGRRIKANQQRNENSRTKRHKKELNANNRFLNGVQGFHIIHSFFIYFLQI